MSEAFTVYMGIFDTQAWSAQNIVNFYKDELLKAGFSTNQLPTVQYPKTNAKIIANDPFPGARTINWTVPVFGDFQQTRDTNVPYSEDKAKIAELGKVVATIFTWNLCSTDKVSSDPTGVLRDIFRRLKIEGTTKLSPKILKYSDLSPEGYPAKQAEPVCKETIETKTVKKPNIGLWSLLFGLGVSLVTKGKL